MSIVKIPIEKKEFINIIEVTSFSVEVTQLNLDVNANILVYFYGVYGLLKTESFLLEQPDYDKWTSDKWLINYVVNKYGLVLQNNI